MITLYRWAFSSAICHGHRVSLKLKTHLGRKEVVIHKQVHTGRSQLLYLLQSCKGTGGCHTWMAPVTEPREDPTTASRQSLQAGSSFDMLGYIFRSSTASLLPMFLGKKSKKSHQEGVLDSSLTGLHQEYMMLWLWPFLVLFCFVGFGNVLLATCLLLLPCEEPDLYESSG